jgi:hypothetical protein
VCVCVCVCVCVNQSLLDASRFTIASGSKGGMSLFTLAYFYFETSKFRVFFLCFLFVVLRMKPRASNMLGKQSATEFPPLHSTLVLCKNKNSTKTIHILNCLHFLSFVLLLLCVCLSMCVHDFF